MLKVTALLLLVVFFICNSKGFNATETQKRYDGAQLLRLYYTDNATLINLLEDVFGGDIWHEDDELLDVAFNSENVDAVKNYLALNKVPVSTMSSNIQKLVDEEQLRNQFTSRSRRTHSDYDSGIHWENYHDLDVINGFLEDVNEKYPKITKLFSIGKTAEGRELKVLSISENPKKNKKIWIDGGLHSREWITPAVVTYIIDQIVTNWKDQPKRIKKITWYFMPVANPDGYVYSHKTDRMWRKNRSTTNSSECIGVDINRNFPTGWEYGEGINFCGPTYKGTEPSSELETKAITKFLLKNKSKFFTYLSFHSYNQLILFPYAYANKKVKNHNELQAIGVLVEKRIRHKTGQHYRAGKVTSLSRYSGLGGTSIDWAHRELGAQYSYAMELRDVGRFGFLLPADQIIPSGQEAMILVNTLTQAMDQSINNFKLFKK